MSFKFPDPPTSSPVQDSNGAMTAPWIQFFSILADVARPMSGTTAQRPTKGLYPGMAYFDQSLGDSGKPIWVNKSGTGWVDATGTAA